MKRREFITLLGSVSFGVIASIWGNLISFGRPAFGKHTAQTVATVADLMFPGDGLPKATELGIHNRIIAMPSLRALLINGADWLDRQAKHQGATDFLALDENAKSAVVDMAFASKEDTARRFVYMLRFHGGLFYYTDPVIKAAFPYTGPPQPNGFADFQDPPA